MLTTSPEAMPSPAPGWASSRTSASPVVIAHAKLELVLEREVTDRERGAHGSLGVVLVGDGSAEQRHHRVADELLHGAAVTLELGAQARVIGREQLLDVLRVHRLRL